MAGGLAALLDDVAAIAKMASAASTKAAAVVIDDAAVTPRYVTGFTPARELPIIWRIAKGSLVNKAILIVALLVLDHFLPQVLTPLLMCGGLYLAFEGAEKLWEAVSGAGHHDETTAAPVAGTDREASVVKGAITTDFILSAEIMMISFNQVKQMTESLSIIDSALALVAVAILITVLVYGAVAVIVKMDDIGLRMTEDNPDSTLGNLLLNGMPKVLKALSVIGVAAMLWVGGHILLDGAAKLGWHAPLDIAHHIAEFGEQVPGIGAVVGWLLETLFSAIVAIVLGGVIVAIVHLLGKARGDHGVEAHIVEERPQAEGHSQTDVSQASTSSDGLDASSTHRA